MSDLKHLTDKVVAFRDERDWKQFHNPKDMAVSLVLEATEVLELFQWQNGEQLETRVNERKQDLSDELADVAYWVLLMARDFDINLGEAIERKLKKTAEKYPVEKAKGQAKKYTEL